MRLSSINRMVSVTLFLIFLSNLVLDTQPLLKSRLNKFV